MSQVKLVVYKLSGSGIESDVKQKQVEALPLGKSTKPEVPTLTGRGISQIRLISEVEVKEFKKCPPSIKVASTSVLIVFKIKKLYVK